MGHFLCNTGVAASALEAEEPKLNKSSAFRARPTPPKPTEVEDISPLPFLTFAAAAFSVRLSPEPPELNFLLGFKAFTNASSYVEV
jgi:hypothetical protein